MKNIDIVIPCFNEIEVLDIFYNALNNVLEEICEYNFNFIFVDDGSSDKTLCKLKFLSNLDKRVKYISFSRNFGKEASMLAGLKHSKGDMVLIIDADMQNPPELIPHMIKGIEEGYECCAGYRVTRKGESRLRNIFTNMFYKLTNRISEVNMPNGAGDFRLMSRKMVNAILALSEVQRFSKGIFSWVGFKTKWISFENKERAGGQSKWNFFKLFSYAIDGITAFSIVPLRIASFLGTIISFSSFIYLFYIIIKTITYGIEVPGYASIITLLLFIGGIIILVCGIMGEYIGRIYLEVKNRPVYIVAISNLEEENKKEN